MIRVLIVDGQAEVRRGLRMRLAIEPDMTVIGDTSSAEQVLDLAQALDPDVILLDTEMRGTGGADMVKRVRAVAPAAGIVVLTLYYDENTRAQVQGAGALAYLEKHGDATELVQVLRRLVPRPLTEGVAHLAP